MMETGFKNCIAPHHTEPLQGDNESCGVVWLKSLMLLDYPIVAGTPLLPQNEVLNRGGDGAPTITGMPVATGNTMTCRSGVPAAMNQLFRQRVCHLKHRTQIRTDTITTRKLLGGLLDAFITDQDPAIVLGRLFHPASYIINQAIGA
jgi:hypothetical protein